MVDPGRLMESYLYMELQKNESRPRKLITRLDDDFGVVIMDPAVTQSLKDSVDAILYFFNGQETYYRSYAYLDKVKAESADEEMKYRNAERKSASE